MKMWLAMLAVVVMSGSTVIAADTSKHESTGSEATSTTDKDADKTEKETSFDLKSRLRELIDSCKAGRDTAAKPQLPAPQELADSTKK